MKGLRSLIVVSAVLSACFYNRSAPMIRCLKQPLPNSHAYDPMRSVRQLVTDVHFRQNLGLPEMAVEDLQIEEDPQVCGRISRALGRVSVRQGSDSTVRAVYTDVLVIRLGAAGYYVYSMWHSQTAGEFLCYAFVFDLTLRRKERLCG